MSIGDQADISARLRQLIPSSWFKTPRPNLDAMLAGIAANESFIYSLIQYAKGQTRLQSTTDGFVDIAAWDFFGPTFQRRANEADAAFVLRIVQEILRERTTRKGISQALIDLTGVAPVIIEPFNPNDTWAWDVSAWDVSALGDLNLNNQIFIIAYRPAGGGIANIAGWDSGYWDATLFWIDQSMGNPPVSDAQIYATIAANVAAGVTAWVMILNAPVALANELGVLLADSSGRILDI